MKLVTIPNYIKTLIKNFRISLKWDEIIEYEVKVRSLSKEPVKLEDRGVKVKEASLNEIFSLFKKRRNDFIDYKDRLKLNHKCFVARVEGTNEITGYTWLSVNKYRFPKILLNITLKEDVAYISNAYTFPKFRGKGVTPRIQMKIIDYLFSHNYRKVYAIISKTNPSMMKFVLPKYRKIRTHHFKRLIKTIKAKSRNPFLQNLYELFKLIRNFRSIYNISFKGNSSH